MEGEIVSGRSDGREEKRAVTAKTGVKPGGVSGIKTLMRFSWERAAPGGQGENCREADGTALPARPSNFAGKRKDEL